MKKNLCLLAADNFVSKKNEAWTSLLFVDALGTAYEALCKPSDAESFLETGIRICEEFEERAARTFEVKPRAKNGKLAYKVVIPANGTVGTTPTPNASPEATGDEF